MPAEASRLSGLGLVRQGAGGEGGGGVGLRERRAEGGGRRPGGVVDVDLGGGAHGERGARCVWCEIEDVAAPGGPSTARPARRLPPPLAVVVAGSHSLTVASDEHESSFLSRVHARPRTRLLCALIWHVSSRPREVPGLDHAVAGRSQTGPARPGSLAMR